MQTKCVQNVITKYGPQRKFPWPMPHAADPSLRNRQEPVTIKLGADPRTFGADSGAFGADPGTCGADPGAFGADPGAFGADAGQRRSRAASSCESGTNYAPQGRVKS